MKVCVVLKVIHKLKGLLSAKEAAVACVAMIISTTTKQDNIWLMTYATNKAILENHF